MTYIFESGDRKIHQHSNAMYIANALYYYGQDVTLWSPGVIPHRKMILEKSPKFVFYHSPVSDKFKSFAEEHGVTLIDVMSEFDKPISDMIMFKQYNKSEIFNTKRLAFLQYPNIENTKSYTLALTLSENYLFKCKIFSVLPLNGANYCGWIPVEYHALAFSSADEVVTLSEHTAINASLCNSNVFVENKKYNISEEDRKNTSNISIARKYISEDTQELYDKFFASI